ncbi:hypothetical protein GCM10023350_34620 [Nocardioides endophyticus]|uniref:Uncharacterized protein n=1 Tax=Nocardioides endophyticus TaxID=1353775 RepID=A0ABP8Z5D3_9ACTN
MHELPGLAGADPGRLGVKVKDPAAADGGGDNDRAARHYVPYPHRDKPQHARGDEIHNNQGRSADLSAG